MVDLSAADSAGGIAAYLPSITSRHIAHAVNPKSQEYIILPTERCNLRCSYCYEDFLVGQMSDDIQLALERLIDRRIPELERLSFNWFGGEPLVARAIVLRLAKHAFERCRSENVTFSGGMTTNGFYLDKELLEDLVDLNQSNFQVTLDGWQTGHDEVRKFADGRGSFETIWQNLLNARLVEGRFQITLRIHVRRDNHDNLHRLMREVAKAFGHDRRFTLNFQHLRNLGGDGGRTVQKPLSVSELMAVACALEQTYRSALSYDDSAECLRTSQSSSDLNEGATGPLRPGQLKEDISVCYAARPSSLLIRADGRIAKCTVALYDRRNTIGNLMPDGTLAIDRDKLLPWLRGLGTLNPMELACPFKGLPA